MMMIWTYLERKLRKKKKQLQRGRHKRHPPRKKKVSQLILSMIHHMQCLLVAVIVSLFATGGKSSVLLDVKPWDDETDMVKLEEAVRSVSMPGLLWGASKLQPVGYGIKKLQIMMTIVDDLVSVDNLIEEYLTEEPRNEYIQSCDIVAFNKI
ncbi:hypothetical protein KP509_23G080700 [Ceratopteris richardii]|uniref:Translation elongation factor EF1B beta/delta subunit guanine nucleotide exchange domain-containing protein n=1 Tax=Ceratopteris richardii TaxID=49495 RepID=A0A8T2S3M5_CERRI|nr:hypothetical protein KP509_23G080700 [Ceratopteris richardii]